MPRLVLPSFAKGELAPGLYSRVDTEAYHIGLMIARNCIIHSLGGVSNRPGTKFTAPVKTHSITPRLVTFQFKTEDSYVLEFGNEYMRVIRNDARVTEAEKNITAVSLTDPVVVTSASHGYSNGDEVFIDGIVGTIELNNRAFIVANVDTNTFELTHQHDGSDIDGTGFTTYSSGGTVAKIFELATPYLAADLFQLVFTQSADIMTITHRSYDPRDLSRTDHNAWTLAVNVFKPEIDAPEDVTLVSNGADNSVTYRYKVTAISDGNPAEESLAGLDDTEQAITGATQANPVVITATSHPYVDGDEIQIDNIVGMTQLNGRRFIVQNADTNDFELQGEDGTSHTAYASGGIARATFVEITDGTTVPDNTLTWTAETGAIKYAVYRRFNGIYGLVGETELTTFTEDFASEVIPALTVSPPRARNPFLFEDNFPAASSYYEQRQVYGGTNNNPDTSFYSQTGRRKNMSISIPLQADDAITAVLQSTQVNEIRHFVPADDLIILTSGSEWRINSGLDVGFSFDTIKQKPQSELGSSFLPPYRSGNTIVFLEQNNARVQGLDRTQNGSYEPTELSELASHLFRGFTAVDLSYSHSPEPRFHYVRNDGRALAMTYNKTQEVVAWTRWDTLGKFKATTTIRHTSSTEDSIYFVVQRIINGNTVQYIEKLASREFTDVRDCFFVDCGLTYDVPLTISAVTLGDPIVVTSTSHGITAGETVELSDIEWEPVFDEDFEESQPDKLNDRRYLAADVTTHTFALVIPDDPSPITGATQANPCVITSTGHPFENGDKIGIFDVQGMTELNGITYTVANVTANTFELSGVNSTGFTAYTSGGKIYHAEDGSVEGEDDTNLYIGDGFARVTVSTIFSLNHLEGRTIIMLVDGGVIEGKVVTNGQVALDRPAVRVHAGLRYISDVETLNLESKGNTIQGQLKRVHHVTLKLEKTRGLLVGPNRLQLTEMKQRRNEKLGAPTALITDDFRISLKPDWNSNGRIFVRQKYPLPFTLLGAAPEYILGDDE